MNKNQDLSLVMVNLFLVVIGLLVVVPLIYVVIISITPIEVMLKNNGYTLLPDKINFEAYYRIMQENTIVLGLINTIILAVLGSITSLALTIMIAYPLSIKDLPLRSLLINFIVFTMLFGGGLIPTYLLVKSLGLINSIWAIILPAAIGVYCALILKSFFETIPLSLIEAARIEGAGEIKIMLIIVLPLSIPALVTIILFYAVGFWNTYLPAIMYIKDASKMPLQPILRSILIASQASLENVDVQIPGDSVKSAAVIVAALPIIMVYPFLQKFFIKGMVIGAIKG